MLTRCFPLPGALLLAWVAALTACGTPTKARSERRTATPTKRTVAEKPPQPLLTVPEKAEVREALQKELEALSVETVHGDLAAPIRAYYEARNHSRAWLLPQSQLKELRGALPSLTGHGIEVAALEAAIDVPSLQEALERAKSKDSPEALAKLDVLLTSAFFRAGEVLDRGQLRPSEHRWHIDDAPAELGEAMDAGIVTGDLEGALLSLAPPHAGYVALLEARQALVELAEKGGWPEVPSVKTLELGDVNEHLPAIRERLRATGELEGSAGDRPSEQTFDEALQAAVRTFQERHGLAPDGKLGPSTLKALQKTVEERIAQVDVNLERWRWFLRELPERHVRVSIAAHELEAWRGEKLEVASRVIVGALGWQTPVFVDEIESIEVNPSWRVPSRIASEEVIPLLSEKPDWAEAQGFHVIDRETGESLAPAEIEWGEDVYAQYRIVQKSGARNPLGKAKFIMRNRYAVFLHGTDVPEAFSEHPLARSHGCVRVQELDALAEFLANDGAQYEAYEEAREGRATKFVELEAPVPVYLTYFTALVDEEGLRFAADVYGRDRHVKKGLLALRDTAGNEGVAAQK